MPPPTCGGCTDTKMRRSVKHAVSDSISVCQAGEHTVRPFIEDIEAQERERRAVSEGMTGPAEDQTKGERKPSIVSRVPPRPTVDMEGYKAKMAAWQEEIVARSEKVTDDIMSEVDDDMSGTMECRRSRTLTLRPIGHVTHIGVLTLTPILTPSCQARWSSGSSLHGPNRTLGASTGLISTSSPYGNS